ncbi:dihydrofolate reductase [Companilactobacillus sp. RD055328]|uniref:dihydrofolate reductase n=1 Tax=Companilactobacillus sp. RD055328 TaxID=2916634 RepID=UPI001FC8936E|nr:dihydrofolate reductase [Companilactobacillus sp. RD055328]GKQ42727.1 dihydrofolate reductase [Companilactobacillus sp. RD055328]
MISFVWAEDKNHVIGKNGKLPWKLPNDMKFFKKVTSGHPIIMGRKTFESFPNGPLPGRENIVITRNNDFSYPGVTVIQDINELNMDPNKNYCVIGGAQIFKLYSDIVDKLFVTKIDHEFTGDTFMVDLPWQKFELVSRIEGKVDEQNLWAHSFEEYERK